MARPSHTIESWTKERDPEFRGKAYPCVVPMNREKGYLTFAHLWMRLGCFCPDLGNGRVLIYLDVCESHTLGCSQEEIRSMEEAGVNYPHPPGRTY